MSAINYSGNNFEDTAGHFVRAKQSSKPLSNINKTQSSAGHGNKRHLSNNDSHSHPTNSLYTTTNSNVTNPTTKVKQKTKRGKRLLTKSKSTKPKFGRLSHQFAVQQQNAKLSSNQYSKSTVTSQRRKKRPPSSQINAALSRNSQFTLSPF